MLAGISPCKYDEAIHRAGVDDEVLGFCATATVMQLCAHLPVFLLGGATFASKADVSRAHRIVKVREADWGYQACSARKSAARLAQHCWFLWGGERCSALGPAHEWTAARGALFGW